MLDKALPVLNVKGNNLFVRFDILVTLSKLKSFYYGRCKGI